MIRFFPLLFSKKKVKKGEKKIEIDLIVIRNSFFDTNGDEHPSVASWIVGVLIELDVEMCVGDLFAIGSTWNGPVEIEKFNSTDLPSSSLDSFTLEFHQESRHPFHSALSPSLSFSFYSFLYRYIFSIETRVFVSVSRVLRRASWRACFYLFSVLLPIKWIPVAKKSNLWRHPASVKANGHWIQLSCSSVDRSCNTIAIRECQHRPSQQQESDTQSTSSSGSCLSFSLSRFKPIHTGRKLRPRSVGSVLNWKGKLLKRSRRCGCVLPAQYCALCAIQTLKLALGLQSPIAVLSFRPGTLFLTDGLSSLTILWHQGFLASE